MKRVMVDMSATLIHHGHVRLLKKASEHGRLIVALTTDDEIKTKKGYQPEISFEHRKEILEAIRYVDEVVPSPWLIEEAFLSQHKIDLLVHGDDNSNLIDENKLLIFPRTSEISSTLLRQRAKRIIEDCTNE
jgi:glycerol-3-phosphate cytidylyltransferase